MRFTTLTLACCLAWLVLTIGCAQMRKDPTPVVTTTPNLPSHVAGLNDSQNPYKDKYSEWDERVYAVLHQEDLAKALNSLTRRAHDVVDDPSQKVLNCWLDNGGNLLPLLEATRLRQEYYRTNGRTRGRSNPFQLFQQVLVPVEMSHEEFLTLQSEQDRIVAAYFPTIPKWLYDSPPAGGAIIHPNGNVVSMGPLGSYVAEDARQSSHGDGGSATSDPQDYVYDLYLFSNSGKLLKHNPGDPAWINLYVEEAVGGLGKAAEPFANTANFEYTRDGYVLIKERQTSNLVGYLDYNGKLTQVGTEPQVRDRHNFMVISPGQIKRYYEAQHSS